MYTVIRQYRTAPQLIEELLKHREEIEQVIRGVPGFVGYYLVQSGEGGASITVCEDQAGTQESTRAPPSGSASTSRTCTAAPRKSPRAKPSSASSGNGPYSEGTSHADG